MKGPFGKRGRKLDRIETTMVYVLSEFYPPSYRKPMMNFKICNTFRSIKSLSVTSGTTEVYQPFQMQREWKLSTKANQNRSSLHKLIATILKNKFPGEGGNNRGDHFKDNIDV